MPHTTHGRSAKDGMLRRSIAGAARRLSSLSECCAESTTPSIPRHRVGSTWVNILVTGQNVTAWPQTSQTSVTREPCPARCERRRPA